MRDLKQFSRYTTGDEQIRLATAYRLGGAIEDRNLLVMTGTMWAVKLANTFSRQYNCRCFFLDLVQEAMIGLIRAAEMFDPDRGFRFSTYATSWIRQKMFRYILNHAEDIRLPVHRVHKLRYYRYLFDRLQRELGREPTDEEIIAAGYTDKDLRTIRKGGHYGGTISLNTVIFEGKNGSQLTLLDTLADPRQAEELIASANREIGSVISRYVREKFKPKVAESFISYFGFENGGPRTLEEIGNKLGLTRERIRQMNLIVIRNPSFRWFAAKLFYESRMIFAPSLDDLRERLRHQDRLAQEVAAAPSTREGQAKRPKKKYGVYHAGNGNGNGKAPKVHRYQNRPKLLAEIPPASRAVADSIISATERHYALPAGELKSASRHQQIVYARNVAAQLIRERTNLSWDHIGAILNRCGANFNTASLQMRRNFQENIRAWESFQSIKTSVMQASA